MKKPKFRIKEIKEPGAYQGFYVCEERHWLWGWGDMFVVKGYDERYNQHFSTENEAKNAIQEEVERRKGEVVKIVWEGKI